MDFLGAESMIRLASFGGVLAAMALWEILTPRRHPTTSRTVRWLNNLALVGLDTVVVRILIPLGAVGLALVVQENGWGVLNQFALPAWLPVVIGFLALDLVIYLQHVLFHAVPALWRLHMVHHADLDFDTTTGLRFHPIEIILSMVIKMGAVLLLGVPALGVLVFEVMLNATSLFNHGNVRLPARLDALLRWFVVTPDMHRVHHSTDPRETNSNFGFNLPWWDYLLGTYWPQPRAGHDGMEIGLEQYRDRRVQWLHWMLLLPFVGRTGDYAVNRPATIRLERPRQPEATVAPDRQRVGAA